MDEVTRGFLISVLLMHLVATYFIVKAAVRRGLSDPSDSLPAGAVGFYFDNLGKINDRLSFSNWISDDERRRLEDLKEQNESILYSGKEPDWIIAELAKVNHSLKDGGASG
ncbi:MAG: hypothetical protein QM705_08755 [Ancrocorticia sp.]